MREIKFRALGRSSKDYKTLRLTKPFNLLKYTQYSESAQDKLLPVVGDDVIFMQYTGLKDKNGVEIYEGDIICMADGPVYTVWWNAGGFGIKNVNDDAVQVGSLVKGFRISEVIGNIYENPELLNQPNQEDIEKGK
jgi:uncharacterized phage protein (TIGR01671 family)